MMSHRLLIKHTPEQNMALVMLQGLQVTLETPLGNFRTCFRYEEGTNKCLVVSMHTVFCGKIKGISERAEQWEKQCNAADVS